MRVFEILNWYFASLGVTPLEELDIVGGAAPAPDDPLRVIIAPTVMDALKFMPQVARAYLNSEPLLLITLEGELKSHGVGHHIDLLEIMEAITKYNTFVSHSNQVEVKITGAIASTITSRIPSHMIFPIDMLTIDIENPSLWPLLERHGRGKIPVVEYNWPIPTENA